MLAARRRQLDWIGYLSTTGVYGDRGGAWVDETSPTAAVTERGRRRRRGRAGLARLRRARPAGRRSSGWPASTGRAATRSSTLRDGTARRIVKPGQVFNRIHVDDIAGVLTASIGAATAGRVYNVCDDEPAPPQDVVAYAAQLLGLAPPPEIAIEAAALTPMAQSFFSEIEAGVEPAGQGRAWLSLPPPDLSGGAGIAPRLSRSTVARLRQLLDGRDQERDVAGPRQPMVAALDQGEADVVAAQGMKAPQRVVIGDVGILVALQDARRTGRSSPGSSMRWRLPSSISASV